jgi:hypothetical protein
MTPTAASADATGGAAVTDPRTAETTAPAEPHVITCEDCDGRHFLLVRFEGCIRFQCANCGARYIDDEGFGRP